MPNQELLTYTTHSSALGMVLIAKSELGICAILLDDDPVLLRTDLQRRFPHARIAEGEIAEAARVIKYIENPTISLSAPLDIRGTAFQKRVWAALQLIPTGTTTNYSELAQNLAMPKAVRAVASACAANALAVVIPCHRVVRSDGGMAGYRWGLERKKQLLHSEKQYADAA